MVSEVPAYSNHFAADTVQMGTTEGGRLQKEAVLLSAEPFDDGFVAVPQSQYNVAVGGRTVVWRTMATSPSRIPASIIETLKPDGIMRCRS